MLKTIPNAAAKPLPGTSLATGSTNICRQMACSKSWLYKWKKRYQADDLSWAQPRSQRPRSQVTKTPKRIAQAIIELRQSLAQTGGHDSAAAIVRALTRQGLAPVPSHRTIYRILQRHKRNSVTA